MPNFSYLFPDWTPIPPPWHTANNLANLNTIGFKDQQIEFADLFYQNLGTDGACDPIQQGAGVQVSSQTSDFTQGDVSATASTPMWPFNWQWLLRGRGERCAELHPRRQFRNRHQQPARNRRRSNGDGISRHQWRRQHQRGTEHARTRSRNQQSRHRHRQPTDDHQPQCHRGRGLDLFTTATIYDSLGAPHQLTVTYTNTGVNTWSYQLSIPSADLSPTVSGRLRCRLRRPESCKRAR